MSWFAWSLVIFLTALAVFFGAAWWMGRADPGEGRSLGRHPGPRLPLARLADPAPLPGELPIAGRFDVDYLPGPPFAGATRDGYDQLDTAPLLIMSEKMAANAALEREIPRLCVEAEAKIPPRWR